MHAPPGVISLTRRCPGIRATPTPRLYGVAYKSEPGKVTTIPLAARVDSQPVMQALWALASDDLSASTATGESGKGILRDFNAPPGRDRDAVSVVKESGADVGTRTPSRSKFAPAS